MERRSLLKGAAALGLLRSSGLLAAAGEGAANWPPAVSVSKMPTLTGPLTLYLGHGEGGLYAEIIEAIEKRNPELGLSVRRAPSSALANTLVAENKFGGPRADLFWSVDAATQAMVSSHGMGIPVPPDVRQYINPEFRWPQWASLSGRIRTIAYNPNLTAPKHIPDHIMDLPDSDLHIGWAPGYSAFQAFIAAMRLLEGEERTRRWLLAMKPRAKSYAGELSVVLATSQGEVDAGLANHYYTLRLKAGRPEAPVELAFTRNDAGSLVNVSGITILSEGDTAVDFVRYLLTREAQSFLAEQAYEIPMVRGVAPPEGIPPLSQLEPPDLDLSKLANLRPALKLLRETGVL